MSKDRGEKAPLILPLDPAPWTPSAQPSLDVVGGGDAGVYGEPSIMESTPSLLILAQPGGRGSHPFPCAEEEAEAQGGGLPTVMQPVRDGAGVRTGSSSSPSRGSFWLTPATRACGHKVSSSEDEGQGSRRRPS